MFAIIGILSFLLALLFIPLGILATIFWIWMLIDAVTNKGVDTGEKIAWVLVILFTHVLGAIIYFFIGRPRGTAAI